MQSSTARMSPCPSARVRRGWRSFTIWPSCCQMPNAIFPLDVISHLDRWTAEGVHSASRVMAVSATTAADLMRIYGLPESKIVVLRNAHDSGVFRADIPTGDVNATLSELRIEIPYFLHVGTAQPRKNIPAVTRAFESLLSTNQIPHCLVLAGGAGWEAADGTRVEVRQKRANCRIVFAVERAGRAPDGRRRRVGDRGILRGIWTSGT